MKVTQMSGKAQTVLGPISGKDLGVTQTHEHLIIDAAQAIFSQPDDAEGKKLAFQPVTVELVPWVRQHRNENADSCRLVDVDEAIKEALLYKELGGKTICDMSNYGLGRDPKALVRKLRSDVETAVRQGRIDYEESGRLLRFYEEGLQGYTYLEGA